LLFEETIVVKEIVVNKYEKWEFSFFDHPYQNIPDFKITTTFTHFDIFAASFYLLSRYEEYLPGKRDEHNRFKASESLAHKNGFLHLPIIDIWLIEFSKLLKKQYPEITFKTDTFSQINTIDIDFAYKYKGHNAFSRTKKFIGSILRGKPSISSLILPEKDPYDTYDFLISEASKNNIETLFFFLLANYGGHDKNISPESPEMIDLVAKLSESFKCGIHPSYKAALNPKLFLQEIAIYKSLTGENPVKSRNHFLKIKIPETYIQLEKQAILKDYSMAYSTHVGFRASTSFPFYFFDLHENCKREVQIYSPCVMDVILKNNLALSPENAVKVITELKNTTKQVNGTFISIWHNSNFDPTQGWFNWEQVYKSLFK
jgi:hypothetical protein